MMVTWKDIYVDAQRRQDEIARARFYNTVRHMVESRPIRERFYHRWLAALGAVLENWGCALQARYATLTTSYQVEENTYSSRC